MSFKDEIMTYESINLVDKYIYKNNVIPVMITAVHTMEQHKDTGIKKPEIFTKSIAQYVANKVNCSYYIKLKDDGIDSNSINQDQFKDDLLERIKENNIRLLIDIHGASIDRDFDVEFGTLNNIATDFSTIKELEEAFNKYGITNIKINDPFKGGGITQFIYSNTDIDIIQIEINKKFRDYNNFDNMEKICNSLINFLNQYKNK